MLRIVAIALSSLAFAIPALACSLCSSPVTKRTFREEFDYAQFVVFGSVTKSQLLNLPGQPPGRGMSELTVEKTLKAGKDQPKTNTLNVERYVPVLDPKKPPQFVVFFDQLQGKWDGYLGVFVKSPAYVEYLQGIAAISHKDRLASLQFYGKFLDHADDSIATDAFLEFAKARDDEVNLAAKSLSPERIRQILKNPNLDADRVAVFSFMLGACGNDSDAAFLQSLMIRPTAERISALDGILAGYITLRPREGWELTYSLLSDRKQTFAMRFGVMKTLRFFQGCKPQELKAQILHGMGLAIPDGELSDLAVEDLRRWKTWDHTKLILNQFGNASHQAPIVQRAIVRYAMSCPQPEAKTFVDTLRQKNPMLVRYVEESLSFEKMP